MKKILLCCSAGMSTSMLVKKMEKVASDRELVVEIAAIPMAGFEEAIETYDVCLLGPQIKLGAALLLRRQLMNHNTAIIAHCRA